MEMAPKKPEVAPTEVTPKAKRRTFSNGFKRKILAEVEAAADEPGKVAALLRKHGLYTSHLSEWRRARDGGELGGQEPTRRGPPPPVADPSAGRVRELELQLAQMTLRAERAEMLVELQKKVAALLSMPSTTNGETR
jgi:transposase-like protein